MEGINGGERVLVHCDAGISRSATMVIAFLIKIQNMTLPNALKFLKTKRPEVEPNHGFLYQLFSYEKSLYVDRDSTPFFLQYFRRSMYITETEFTDEQLLSALTNSKTMNEVIIRLYGPPPTRIIL
uniref:protein-tyrosine-phosphatase n=1 Tax=Arcella intermedia TaxID=1963864 RepID=A0A6B2LJQ5_9EUKA|eukprot:TRINITY_DN9688_c0_g1_i3.p1 TRINITY_DN9688_c0_g1~~TRINITY_DN9688_c0_g1_i3.p1  ORF type:complete len:126 (+),score=13.52 TRINITY_DN9688_c0_g1_i3:227-604(+)